MERPRERRKLWLAIFASILLHLVIALSLAAFSRAPAPAAETEEKPSELTFVDLAPTPAPLVAINPTFIETNPAKASAEKPKEQTFESNENSIAASDVPARGDAPVPSQEGKDRPFLNLETQALALRADGKTAQPDRQPSTPAPLTTPVPVATPKPSEAPKSTPTPPPISTPEPEQFAMLTSTPPPPMKEPEEPTPTATPRPPTKLAPPVLRPEPTAPAASAYQPQKEQTRVSGRITNRGPASVNAVGTPLGRYQKMIYDAIGSRWYYYVASKNDLITIGTAQVTAEVDATGTLRNLRLVSNTANEAFANVCLQSFQDAKIPPIPPELIPTLPNGRFLVEISFTDYSNR